MKTYAGFIWTQIWQRLAVTLLQETMTKLLRIYKTHDSTSDIGGLERERSGDCLGFDMTNSNTGIKKEASTILQEVLRRQLLCIWAACRHHVLELVIGAPFTDLF